MSDLHRLESLIASSVINGSVQFTSFNAGGLAIVEYNFATHGGAVGNIDLQPEIPANSLVMDGMIRVITAPTSGGSATIALQLEGTADLLAATAIASLTVGRHNIVPVGTAATSVLTTVARRPRMVIGTAALTAGRIQVLLRYVTLPA